MFGEKMGIPDFWKGPLKYSILVGVNFVYACVSIAMKAASVQEPLTMPYFICLVCAFCGMAVYALLWQQVLKRIPVGDAYMFKGTSLIFVLLFSVFLFDEGISATNVLGACIIIGGIVLYARAE